MTSDDHDWKPGSFTKNFGWGPRQNGLSELYEAIRIGFNNQMEDVPRQLFIERVEGAGKSHYIPVNFFLFNKIKNGVSHIVADELVFQALNTRHSPDFDKLAVFALNFSYAGKWIGSTPNQRRPALWASNYVAQKIAEEYKWDTERVSAKDIENFVSKSPKYKALSAGKLATNLNYIYQIGHLSELANRRVERWWVDALFLALDRIIEDRSLDGLDTGYAQLKPLLDRSIFHQVAGARSMEKDLASEHLVQLYEACGSRERFSDEHVRERTQILLPDIPWLAANDNQPIGAVHPSNPRIAKMIPRACAMLAKYVGFETISAEELTTFDLHTFIRNHSKQAIARLKEKDITPIMSVEELIKLTRGK